MDRPLRIGTRGSALALAQAHMVANALRRAHGWSDDAVEIVPITTTGDKVQDRPLADIGGKALWTKELDRYLIDGTTDISVHSMKDVETIRPESMTIAAMLERADPRDRLIGAVSLEAIPAGARFGTSSPRRAAQIRARRPDLVVEPIRGNVETRLGRIERGEFAATLLAAAGLTRLGLGDVGHLVPGLIPAPAQGAIGIEARSDDAEVLNLLAAIDHAETSACVTAERAFLAAIGGDCRSAVAVHARLAGGRIAMEAELLLPDGSETRRGRTEFAAGEDAAAAALARELLGRASDALRAMFAP